MTEEGLSPSTFLLSELKRARSSAGLNQEDLGRAINYSGSLVSAVETGQRPPTRDYLAKIDEVLETGGLFARLHDGLASFERTPVWFRDWLIIEREATLIRWFEPLIIPGILQTKEYAHAIIAGSGMARPDEVDQQVAARLDRRSLLSADVPPTLVAIIDEGVIRRDVGSPEIMKDQCAFLAEMAALPHVYLHIVPSAAGAYAGLAGAFTLAKGRDFEVAHLDNPLQAQITSQTTDIDSLARRWEAVRGEALPRTQSLDLIKEAARTWQT